ncbi:MAG: hypothetical protein ABI663_00610 [Chryseolinea sp.]
MNGQLARSELAVHVFLNSSTQSCYKQDCVDEFFLARTAVTFCAQILIPRASTQFDLAANLFAVK